MDVASWNVNSIRARKERLLAWLEARPPDLVCLQELKCTESQFPMAEVRALGYEVAVHGQKTYNGVAILSRVGLEDVAFGFGDGEEDGAARLVSATAAGVRVLSVYVPNGQTVGSDKYTGKLAWMRRLRAHLDARYAASDLLAVCGDFNVAPDERDVQRPDFWSETVLFHPEARAALRAIAGWGLTDTFRQHEQGAGFYSWWDYRKLAFPRNDGLRLDLILASPALARLCTAAGIERNERKGQTPSDHVPVTASFDLGGAEPRPPTPPRATPT